ncbi:MAG: hypothetical protein U5N86_13415 [Planctomycetota bacterium]|nr:hypothetical protein [Planctomycetota bacterium]
MSKRDMLQRLLAVLLVLCFATLLAFAEDVGNQAIRMGDNGFSIGTLTFVRIPAGSQPLPHIKGGFADYDGEQSDFQLPEFCMATRNLNANDLADVRRELGIFGRALRTSLAFNDYEIALLTNRLNRDFIPVRDGEPVSGRYCIATAALFIRALFFGGRCEKEMPRQGAFSRIRTVRLADRFSEYLNWSGEAQPGELTPTCSEGRLGHLMGGTSRVAWPSVEDRNWYIKNVERHPNNGLFNFGSPWKVSAGRASVVLCFVFDQGKDR